MRPLLLAALALLPAASLSASANPTPLLLKTGASPPKGWSVVVFQTDSIFSGGRIKLGESETCESTDTAPCHFAAPDGPVAILIDQPLELGDTTATLAVAGGRIYVLKSGQNNGRAAGRAIGGLLGGLAAVAASQPDDPPAAGTSTAASGAPSVPSPPEPGTLSAVRLGSRFDVKFVSASEPGKAESFVVPAEK